MARHYDVGASAKTLDWFNLMTTAGVIYGGRVMLIAAERRARQQGQAGPAGPVVNGHDPGDYPGQGGAQVGENEIDWSRMTGGRGPVN